MKHGKRALAGFAAAFLGVSLAACGGSNASTEERDTSARAKLDRESAQILTPFSAYLAADDPADLALMDQAKRVYTSKCMAEKGLTYTATGPEDAVLDDRTFGIWDEQLAADYGWGTKPSSVTALEEQEEAAGGDAWTMGYEECQARFEKDPDTEVLRKYNVASSDRADELSTQALNAAAKDEEWERVHKEWAQCLTDAGLTAPKSKDMWASVDSQKLLESEGSQTTQEGIRLASIEARCNNQTSTSQRLGDLVASYQQPLIDKHEAELKPAKEDKDRVLSAAREYIARNG